MLYALFFLFDILPQNIRGLVAVLDDDGLVRTRPQQQVHHVRGSLPSGIAGEPVQRGFLVHVLGVGVGPMLQEGQQGFEPLGPMQQGGKVC